MGGIGWHIMTTIYDPPLQFSFEIFSISLNGFNAWGRFWSFNSLLRSSGLRLRITWVSVSTILLQFSFEIFLWVLPSLKTPLRILPFNSLLRSSYLGGGLIPWSVILTLMCLQFSFEILPSRRSVDSGSRSGDNLQFSFEILFRAHKWGCWNLWNLLQFSFEILHTTCTHSTP